MTINEIPKVMLNSLLITLTVELLVGLLLQIRGKDLIIIVLVNIMTNPLLNALVICVNYYYGLKVRLIVLIILELLAFISEGFVYYKFYKKKYINGFIISLILNLSSYFIGSIINEIIY